MNGKTDWLAICVVAFLIAVGAVAGGLTVRYFKNAELAEQKTTYTTQIAAANKAALAADERAQGIQRTINSAILSGVAEYTQKDTDEKSQDARTIAALRNDVSRLRVKTNNPVCRNEVRGAATSASAGAGEVETTLAPAVAARLAGRYADFNTVVRQLDLCQAVAAADRIQVAVDPPAR